jgi:membrane associated rhomboid family serine protease
MGLFNRTYWKDDQGGSGQSFQPAGFSGLTAGLPALSPAVKILLIINVAVFIVQQFWPGMSGVFGVTVASWWQVWRYVTFQFLHANTWHILLNMMGVYMLGVPLERHWGTRRFIRFYLGCGVVAGIAYAAIGYLFHLDHNVPIIGASGGAYAIVLACAVLFPNFQLIFLFFPVPIRLACIVIFSMMIFNVMGQLASGYAGSAMSDVAHLGGAVAAAIYLYWPRLLAGRMRVRVKAGRNPNPTGWDRKMEKRRAQQAQIDRILAGHTKPVR